MTVRSTLVNSALRFLAIILLPAFFLEPLAFCADDPDIPPFVAKNTTIGPAERYWLLRSACYSGDDMSVKMLLAAGADPDGTSDFKAAREVYFSGEPSWPINLAAWSGHTDVIKILLDAGAQVDHPEGEGVTALLLATKNNHPQAVELLLKAGADPQYKGPQGTALEVAQRKGLAKIIKLLDPSRSGYTITSPGRIDETSQFIFFSVLEGLYQDGLTNEDVDQILRRTDPEGAYEHFIYACPICTATIWGLQAYRSRPERLYSLKLATSTFGPGLSKELHDQLYSPDSDDRLIAINALVQKWIARRIELLNLTASQRATLQADLEDFRKQGMQVLKSFRENENSMKAFAPGYRHLDECASCNGAVGQVMKLPDAEKKTP